MFDNPKEQLKQLEDQLLAAEQNKDEKFERLYAELFEEYGPEPQEDSDEVIYRNYANSYGKNVKKAARPQAVQTRSAAPAESYTDGHEDHAEPDRSIKVLVIIICIEILGIAALAAWWGLRIMSAL